MTVSIASGPATAQVSSSLRLTQRGKQVLALLLWVPLVLGMGIGLTQIPAADAGVPQRGVTEQFATHTVLSGETLWQIADSIAGERDVRDVVQEIMRLNLLESASLQAGQQLALPNK